MGLGNEKFYLVIFSSLKNLPNETLYHDWLILQVGLASFIRVKLFRKFQSGTFLGLHATSENLGVWNLARIFFFLPIPTNGLYIWENSKEGHSRNWIRKDPFYRTRNISCIQYFSFSWNSIHKNSILLSWNSYLITILQLTNYQN